jgi:hypothetical protein
MSYNKLNDKFKILGTNNHFNYVFDFNYNSLNLR